MADQQQFQIQVNTERLKNTRVHFCIPCYGGMLTEQTFMSFIKWGNTARQLGIEWAIETMNNESLISRGRNTLTAKFLNNTESTHLMFIDADIGWEPWHLLAMIDRDVDVIGGLYPMKTMPIKWVVNGFEGAEQGEDGLQEVSKTGTGFMLIKRQVFEDMKAHPAVKPYKSDIGLAPELDQHMRTYFDTAVRENRYYSEDWTFCENWRDLGGKIWVDKRVMLRHTGSYVFDQNAQNELYNGYKEQIMADAQQKIAENPEIVTDVKQEDSPAPVESNTETKAETTPKKRASRKRKTPAKKKPSA